MELYSQSREEAVQTLGTDPARGLNQRECQRRLEQYGKTSCALPSAGGCRPGSSASFKI